MTLDALSVCTDVYCAEPPAITEATVEGLESRDPITGMFQYGALIKYRCVGPGRRFDDGHTTNDHH